MQLHQLRPKYLYKKEKRIGRGGKRGTYSGRGGKGQTARAGTLVRPAIRDLIKKIPKLRGYRLKLRPKAHAIVNLRDIAKRYKEGETVSPETLLQKRLIRRIKGKIPEVKILGVGSLAVSLRFENIKMSASVRQKIEKMGEKGIEKKAAKKVQQKNVGLKRRIKHKIRKTSS